MKCIKSKTTGEIKRVTDIMAWKLETKGWGYIPKSEWKEITRVKKEIKELATEKTVNTEGKIRRNREKKNKR
jgi:signal recognition particle subunit SEC65